MITQKLAESLAGLLFPRKLWVLANCPDVESIQWGKTGTTVLINSVLVEKECFKPNVFNVQSNQHVLRQMSYYNFQKIDRKCKIWEFKHEYFKFAREDLLHLVKRQPQGVPKKYIDDMERRYSSRLQRQSMNGERPNYARMEKGALGSECESEPDSMSCERRPNTRSSTQKRAYHRRTIKVEVGERIRGSSRGRGSRRGGGRGRKRTRQIKFEHDDLNDSFPKVEVECDTSDRLVPDFDQRRADESEYIVPNTQDWLFGGPLQNRMDDLTIVEEIGKFPEIGNLRRNLEVAEDDKRRLRYVVESTERAMNPERQQESVMANGWHDQSCCGTRVQVNHSWSYPDVISYYPTVSEGVNGNNYTFINPHPNLSGNPSIPYEGGNFSRRIVNFDSSVPVSFQYSSSDNVISTKVHTYGSEPLPSYSEISGRQDNIPRMVDVFDDVFRPRSNHIHEHNTVQQKKKSELVDFVTLDHNYNTIKGAFNTLETPEEEMNPLDRTIQSVMQNNDSILAELIEEHNSERSMDEVRSRSSGESLAEAPLKTISPHTSDSGSFPQYSTPEQSQKNSEEHTRSPEILEYSSGALNWNEDPFPNNGQPSISENTVPDSNGFSPSYADQSCATTVAYFLLDSTKYKKYNFTMTEMGDILIKNCAEDFLYWKYNKDVHPQSQITSPCLQVEQYH